MKLFFEILKKEPVLFIIAIGYRVKYIEREDSSRSGYYLVKRFWIWILFSPLLLLLYFIRAFLQFLDELFSFDAQWINTPRKGKLSFAEKMYYYDTLF